MVISTRGGLVTWKPSVSPVGSIPSPNPHIAGSPVPVTKTSLAATYKPGSRPPHGFNSASKPFSPQVRNLEKMYEYLVRLLSI